MQGQSHTAACRCLNCNIIYSLQTTEPLAPPCSHARAKACCPTPTGLHYTSVRREAYYLVPLWRRRHIVDDVAKQMPSRAEAAYHAKKLRTIGPTKRSTTHRKTKPIRPDILPMRRKLFGKCFQLPLQHAVDDLLMHLLQRRNYITANSHSGCVVGQSRLVDIRPDRKNHMSGRWSRHVDVFPI